MTLVTLYDYWRSTASYRVRIALNLKHFEYRSVSVNLLAGEHKQSPHIRRNPQGLVPVLEYNDLLFTQSLAIIEYLEDTHPSPALLPINAEHRARVRAIAYAIAMEIHPICNLSVANHVSDLVSDKQVKQQWMQHYIFNGLSAVEALLDHPLTGKFCHGDSPGLADCCLIPQLYNADRWKVDISVFSRINKIAGACSEVPAFVLAQPEKFDPTASQQQ